MGQPVVHFELWTENPDRIGRFYESVFGWKTETKPEMGYWLITAGGDQGINGGAFTPQKGPWPAKLCLYVQVDSLEESVERVTDAGGKVLVARQEIPNVGSFALFEDVDGRTMGIWETTEQMERANA